MKKLLLTAAIIALTGLNQPAFAHGNEDHGGQQHEASIAETRNPTEALTVLQEGVVLMADTVSEKNRAEMFSDGPIMEKWHEKTVEMQESIDVLKRHAATLPNDKKTRLESSLNQFSKALDDFHVMTHEKDPVKSEKEAKKAQGAVKLIEASLK